ncbi:MAG TPA: DGQHR domain-containing protein [Sphingomicrobium sp.]
MNTVHKLECQVGRSADRQVLLGFASARVLKALSWADILDEEAGRGYQRRFNSAHSLDFRKYIQSPGSATIPLTLNLRPRDDDAWRIVPTGERSALLELRADAGRLLAQVDCQHRLGHLGESDIELPFMCFIGLSAEEEMQVFSVINGKAKGLSRSLLDYQAAQLCDDVASERPELFIALCLAHEPASPWFRALDIGASTTSGMNRRASLRTMQKAVKRFLTRSRILETSTPEQAARLALDFWTAVTVVLSDAWLKPRKHLISKGVGVYALMDIAADLVVEAEGGGSREHFAAQLSEFVQDFDWSTSGAFAGLGGEKGAAQAARMLRDARRKSKMKVVQVG